MKVGIEVEGRFKGIKTLFLDAKEFMNLTNADLRAVARNHSVKQLYVSDHDNQILDNTSFAHNDWREFIITLEVTGVKSHHDTDNVNILLLVEHESFWNLKKTDQIKFSREHHVYAVPVETMYITRPEDFHQDQEI